METMDLKIEQRSNIKFCVKLGKTAAETKIQLSSPLISLDIMWIFLNTLKQIFTNLNTFLPLIRSQKPSDEFGGDA